MAARLIRHDDQLPDVFPWYDTEDEGVYSDDPEDGYPYDV